MNNAQTYTLTKKYGNTNTPSSIIAGVIRLLLSNAHRAETPYRLYVLLRTNDHLIGMSKEHQIKVEDLSKYESAKIFRLYIDDVRCYSWDIDTYHDVDPRIEFKIGMESLGTARNFIAHYKAVSEQMLNTGMIDKLEV